MVTKDLFGPYDRYTIQSGDLEVSVITLGATVTALKYKGAERAVCYQNAEDAIAGHGFLCKGVGRCANRIGGAAFTLEGRRYELPPNEHLNQLHGGPNSVDKRVWDAEILSDSAVRFSIVSPDGDNGYPGTLKMTFTYSVVGSALRVDFGGETDRTTVYAPTVHPYFNLGGESVLDAKLWVNAAGHLEVNDELIPSGETSSYRSNPMKLASFALSRRDPDYVPRAQATHALETARQQGETDPAVGKVLEALGLEPSAADKLQIGSVIFANKPGDGSAREQAASCQRVLGGCANICYEFATKRYRSNCVNWGMLPFTLAEGEEFPCQPGDFIYVPGVRAKVESGESVFPATIVHEGGWTRPITLYLNNTTAEERELLLTGCLMNHYAAQNK